MRRSLAVLPKRSLSSTRNVRLATANCKSVRAVSRQHWPISDLNLRNGSPSCSTTLLIFRLLFGARCVPALWRCRSTRCSRRSNTPTFSLTAARPRSSSPRRWPRPSFLFSIDCRSCEQSFSSMATRTRAPRLPPARFAILPISSAAEQPKCLPRRHCRTKSRSGCTLPVRPGNRKASSTSTRRRWPPRA